MKDSKRELKEKPKESKDTSPSPQYWDELTWAVGARVCVSDGELAKGWGELLNYSVDNLWDAIDDAIGNGDFLALATAATALFIKEEVHSE